jgi:exopolyphosphatase/guanosine-5'-triphosphate,3'-diphosphate pyrophosphatase
LDKNSTEVENLELSDIQFDENYKNFSVGVHFKETFMPKQRIQLSKVQMKVTEYDVNMNEVTPSAQPIFVSAKNLRSEKIKDLGIKGLVLVDLSLGELQIEKQKSAVESLREFVFEDQLYVAFMQGGKVSQTYPATDYVLDNYFVEDETPTMLFRSIATKMEEMRSNESEFFSDTPIENKMLIVFSDGHIYNGDKPVDPKHFEYQEILLNETKQAQKLQFCYVNLNEEKEDEFSVENDVEDLFTYVCKQTGGAYLPELDMKAISDEVMVGRKTNKEDFRLNLTNPDDKIYRGDERILKVTCMYDGKVLFSGSKSYSLGSVYKPVIINGGGMGSILIQAVVFTLILLLFIYVILQLILPYIKYRIFKYKYVTKYTGPNMSWGGIQVPETCYYCKTPFEIGDEIVYDYTAQGDILNDILEKKTIQERYSRMIDRAKQKTNIDVEIISGNEESNLGFMGVLEGLDTDEQILVIDIGGGSTEFILGDREGIKFAKSENVGALRMTEKFLAKDPIDTNEFSNMSKFIYSEIKDTIDYIKSKQIKKIVGIGGTITSLSAMNQELEVYSMEKIHNSEVSIKNIKDILQNLKQMTLNDKKTLKGLQPKRADIITAGVEILNIIMENLEIEKIIVSEYDNLEGLMCHKVKKMS